MIGNLCQVSFSMLEIYNEQIQDLLSHHKAPTGGLKVRETPDRGFYGNLILFSVTIVFDFLCYYGLFS
jgi:hypothetical protein